MRSQFLLVLATLVGCIAPEDPVGLINAKGAFFDILVREDGTGSVGISGCFQLANDFRATLNDRVVKVSPIEECDGRFHFDAQPDAPVNSKLVLEDSTARIEIALGDTLQPRTVTRVPDGPWTLVAGDRVTAAWSHPRDLQSSVIISADGSQIQFDSREDPTTGNIQFVVPPLASGPHKLRFTTAIHQLHPTCTPAVCLVTPLVAVEADAVVR